jgi:hypothetical protein
VSGGAVSGGEVSGGEVSGGEVAGGSVPGATVLTSEDTDGAVATESGSSERPNHQIPPATSTNSATTAPT